MPRTATRTSLTALAAATMLALAACGGGHDKPKATPTPTPTTPSASPSATVAPAAPATCPLTGRVPGKHQKRQRPALAVKIDNVDIARPQAGIDHADIIFEETVEGGLTRLFAVFQCDSAPVIGPVRSARTTDSDLIQMFRTAVFGYSGANNRVNARINSTKGAVPLSYDSHGSLYYRSGSRPAPHNVYTSTSRLVQAGMARSKHLKAPPALFHYAAKTPAHQVVHSISLRWSGFASAGWHWSGKAWKRSQNGSTDRVVSGKQLAVQNVVVMRIKTRFLGLRDVLGNASPDDVVIGKGQVWVFRNGKMMRGKWVHKGARAGLRLLHNDKLIALAPGHTWVELLPPGGSINYGRR